MKKLNVLVVSLGIVGGMNAAEQPGQHNLQKSVSAPLPSSSGANLTRQGAQAELLTRVASVAISSSGGVVGGTPLAPAPSLVSLNEDVLPLQLVAGSQGYQGGDGDSDVATQILSSGEESGTEGDDESFGTPTNVNPGVQFPLSDSANATGNLLTVKK